MNAASIVAKAKPLMPSRGAVLLLAMVFVLLLAIVAAGVMRSAVLQLRMAGNDQFLEEALHGAYAVADELSLNLQNFSLQGDVGEINCAQGLVSQACDRSELQAPAAATVSDGLSVDYRVVRQDPLLWKGFPFRESEHAVSSAIGFDAAMFEIEVRVKGSQSRMGNAHIVQGIALRVAALR